MSDFSVQTLVVLVSLGFELNDLACIDDFDRDEILRDLCFDL